MEKEEFYIFLDIDGVLWDWNWRLDQMDKGKIKHLHFIDELNPKSIEALNLLIDKINEVYNVNLVISSTWRSNLEDTKTILVNNGLKYNGELTATPFSAHPEHRGDEIKEYIKSVNAKNILVIDDETFDIKKHFSKNQIIKTAMYDDSLSKKHVNTWLNENLKVEEKQL